MPLFALHNLSSSAVEPCTPWTYTIPAPDHVKGKENKKARDKWINSPETHAQCYSAFEGINAALRISEPKIGGEEGNPPLKLHAFIADIDCPVSQQELATGIGRLSFRPNYYEITLSGNARLVWLFEAPVSFPNRRFAVEFLKLALTRLHPENVAAGFDRPAWEEPNRYYTNSGEWLQIDAEARIPKELLEGWVVEVSEKHVWRKDKGAIDLPLPVVEAELLKKWPQMNWPGDFVEGSTGPSFWIADSTSPKSAIVKPTGIFTFSAHQAKPFYSWSDLLGKDFVDKHAAELMGKAVENIYHDGSKYYRHDGHGSWKNFSKEDIVLHLTTDRGLSAVKDGGASEVNRALSYIQNWQGIDGAAPFVFQPPGIIKKQGRTFLNTHTRKVLRPADEKAVWGPDGNFPFISALIDGLFHPDSLPADPKEYFLAWLARFYVGAYYFNLESGQSLFFLGAPGIGKTFLSQGLLPHLMSGGTGAEAYLMGESDFNSELFETAFWTIDDNSATVDNATHRKFSAMVKKMAANTVFQYHAKFRIPCSVDWLGRVFITANADEQSARIVPDLSINILDKMHIFRGADKPAVVFPDKRGCDLVIRNETPFLARYLLDYVAPAHVVGTARFGVKSYHEASLMKVAEQSSDTASFREVIEHWRKIYFQEKADLTQWRGSAYELLMEFHKDVYASAAGLRGLNPTAVGRSLMAVKAKGMPIDSVGGEHFREWIIYKDDKAKAAAPITSKDNSKFSK